MVLETVRQGRDGLFGCLDHVPGSEPGSKREITLYLAIETTGVSAEPLVVEDTGPEKAGDCVVPIIRSLSFAPLDPSAPPSLWLIFLARER